MKHFYRLSAVLIALALTLVCLTGTVQAASTVESGSIGRNLSWVFTDDGTLTISGEGDMNFGWSGVPWTGNYSIMLDIKAVVIESGVTSIGTDAFNGCSNLERVTMADTVTTIKGSAFGNCTSLTDITLSANLTTIGQNAFYGCSSLTNISIPDTVTSLGGSAFRKCTGLTSISIPGSVETIYEYTFRNCTGLTEVVFCEGVSVIGDDAFSDCTGLRNITFPMSITLIEAGAFANCTALTEVVIPNCNTGFQEDAFYGCSALTTVTAPGWCGSDVFSNCPNVTSFTVTEGYESDGSSDNRLKLNGFPNLEQVILPSSVAGLHAYEFSHMESLRSVTLPEGLTYIGEESFRGCTGLTTITIPGTVTDMKWNIFRDCTGLTEVIISDGVVALGSSTFWGCTGLTSVTIPGSIDTIDSDVFRCSGLEEVTICDGVRTIGYQSFADCAGLKEISIPDSVTTIGSGAFSSCHSLTSITIPAGVTSLGSAAFYNCTNLYTVYFEGDAPAIVDDTFYDVSATCYYPGGNPTWTAAARDDYHGNLTWVPYCDAHVWGEWYTVQEATCTEEGKQQRDCVNCDHVEEQAIPATGHTYVDGECSCGAKDPDYQAPAQNPFTDVPAGSFFEVPVLWALENGITSGTSATTFDPNGQCMRAHVVTFLWRAAGCPEPTSTENPFVDVQASDFYYKAVLWAVEKGITNGLDATHFGSFAYCNRAQVVTFLYRAMGSPAISAAECPFTDVAPGAWYEAPILWAVENGITNGVGGGLFGVGTICNRAQVVTFLYRTYVS